MTPSSVVNGVAVLMAWRRCVITSAERTWRSRKKVSRVVRRASWAALRGGPAAQKVTENAGIFVLKPWQHLRAIVFQGPGETVRNAHFSPDHVPPMGDELCEGVHGRALRMEWRQLI